MILFVYEHTPVEPLAGDEYDGMEDMLGDDFLPTVWHPEIEDAPYEAWFEHVAAQDAANGKK